MLQYKRLLEQVSPRPTDGPKLRTRLILTTRRVTHLPSTEPDQLIVPAALASSMDKLQCAYSGLDLLKYFAGLGGIEERKV